MLHAVAEEEAVLCPAPAGEPRSKPSTFSEHVSAAIGSRSYIWTFTAIAGILVVSSMMATSARRDDVGGAASQLAAHRHRVSGGDADARLAAPLSPGSGLQSDGGGQRTNSRHSGFLVRSGAERGRKGAARRSAASAEDRQLNAAGAETGEPEYIRQVDGCRSTVCRWQGEYLGGKLDETVDPCMDFYSYACPSRWFHQDTLAAMPYRFYAAGQLMYRLENMFHEFHQADASVDASSRNASFMARASDFFLRCVSKERSRGPWPDLEDLFRHYGLERYPFEASPEDTSSSLTLPNLTRVAGLLDRELGLAAIFRPSLTAARRRRQAQSVVLFLDPPESTPSLRLRGVLGKPDKDALLNKILAGFALLKAPSRRLAKEASQVLGVDQELSAIIRVGRVASSSGHSTSATSGAEPPRHVALTNVSTLAMEYGNNKAWSWEEYARILLGDVVLGKNASKEPRVLVQVDSPEQLAQLSALLGKHEVTALLNYVAFSLAVFLSPALPHGGTAQELLPLSHGEHVPQVPEELQACVHLLARTYRFGALSLARQAVSRDINDGNSYKYEGDVRALVDGAREQVSALLRNRTAWMTAAELWTALQRLDALRVVFLGEPDDSAEHLSQYYAAALSGIGAGQSLARARGSAMYPELRDGPNIPELPGKNSLELFFVNYAVAHCEHSPRSVDVAASADGERALSPAARLNVALMNSRAFAAVFHCKDDDLMNPRSRCEIW
ncbi:uncharacterized protein [Dermacentor albipictus]|uniref:uncharacterized protein isoform X2 n=1 Tax=Dermacentor albipictus TaxID=60249 RepID=UPI0031FC1C37